MPNNNRRRSGDVSGLRIASHNVNGLQGNWKTRMIARLWKHLHLDIVFVQEHKISLEHRNGLSGLLECRQTISGYESFWTYNRTNNSKGSLIAIRRSLIASGSLHVYPQSKIEWDLEGRCVSINADWKGHKLQLACLYLPNDAASQKDLIFDLIPRLLQRAENDGCSPLWGGDFNFVENPNLDRLTRTGDGSGAVVRPSDTTDPVGRMWKSTCPRLIDVFRHRHPTRRSMTRFPWNNQRNIQGCARLDRLYIHQDVIDYATAPGCDVPRRTQSRLQGSRYLSDHFPVEMLLAPKDPGPCDDRPRGGIKRLRHHFDADPALRHQFEVWFDQKIALKPAQPHALVRWWHRRFIPSLKRRVKQLNRIYHSKSGQALRNAQTHYQHLRQVVEGTCPLAAAEALDAIPAAREAVSSALRSTFASEEVTARTSWVHCREGPNKAITMRFKPRKGQHIAALRAPNGDLVADGPGCAKLAVDHWASISAPPVTSAAAQEQVIGALDRQAAPRLPEDKAALLGSPVITEAEVKGALRRSKPGTAPGPDGIPVEFYRRFKNLFASLLAELFTAIGTTERLPRGFLDSIITMIHKRGDRLDCGNYRPISLTNTCSRLLTRVLAGRLGSVLPDLIDPAQTAFVPGRRMGENLHLLQLVASWLELHNRTGVIAFCDFRKAYDTVDRPFLFAVAERLGLGAGFLRWIRLLLTDTKSAAVVNGFISNPKQFLAGMKQGDPLSPPLYLLVGQVALLWLRDQGIGISVAGALITASQFADDLKAFLDGLQQVPLFLEAMATFALASGQSLLPAKTKLLFVGKPPSSLPSSVQGMPVVSSVKALGLVFQQFSGEVMVDWEELLDIVHGRLVKISHCNLSEFGRAFAVNGYALSMILFHAEFTGLPQHVEELLIRWVAAVVVTGICPPQSGPSSQPRRFAGVAKENIFGHPSHGGFGVMPLRQHVTARQACWASQLLTGDPAIPWIRVGLAVLQHWREVSHFSTRLAFLFPPPPGTAYPAFTSVPLLRRLASALHALPPPRPVGALPPPGPWCSRLPLWCNPWLRAQWPELDGSVAAITLRQAKTIRTLGDLLRVASTVHAWDDAQWDQFHRDIIDHDAWFACEDHLADNVDQDGPPPTTYLTRRQIFLRECDLIRQAFPEQVVQAAHAARTLPQNELPTDAEILEMLLDRVFWLLGDKFVGLSQLTVKKATLLQLQGQEPPQSHKLQAFVGLAAADGSVFALKKVLRKMWKLPWDNRRKVVYWRLVLDGLPTKQRLHVNEMCACGQALSPGRDHVFHSCALVRPLWECLLAQLHGDWSLPDGAVLQRAHIWLARPPTGNMHSGIWQVICLAAIAAMDKVRSLTSPRRVGNSWTPSTITPSDATDRCISVFWELLADFCGLGLAPLQWREQVPSGHPFIRFNSESARWEFFRRV